MRYYLRFMLNVIFLIIVYGLLLPFMISAADDILVIGGIIVGVLIAPAVLYYTNKKFVINLMEKFK